jgi:hypothetical protein
MEFTRARLQRDPRNTLLLGATRRETSTTCAKRGVSLDNRVRSHLDREWACSDALLSRKNVLHPEAVGFPVAAGGRAGDDDHPTGHSTQKPVALVERAILNHTGPGDAIFDPFLGSGTTLIAAQKTGRRCLATPCSVSRSPYHRPVPRTANQIGSCSQWYHPRPSAKCCSRQMIWLRTVKPAASNWPRRAGPSTPRGTRTRPSLGTADTRASNRRDRPSTRGPPPSAGAGGPGAATPGRLKPRRAGHSRAAAAAHR